MGEWKGGDGERKKSFTPNESFCGLKIQPARSHVSLGSFLYVISAGTRMVRAGLEGGKVDDMRAPNLYLSTLSQRRVQLLHEPANRPVISFLEEKI